VDREPSRAKLWWSLDQRRRLKVYPCSTHSLCLACSRPDHTILSNLANTLFSLTTIVSWDSVVPRALNLDWRIGTQGRRYQSATLVPLIASPDPSTTSSGSSRVPLTPVRARPICTTWLINRCHDSERTSPYCSGLCCDNGRNHTLYNI
jgi:hypothetical protein